MQPLRTMQVRKETGGEKVSNGTIGEELHAEGKLSLESVDLDAFFLKSMNVLFQPLGCLEVNRRQVFVIGERFKKH